MLPNFYYIQDICNVRDRLSKTVLFPVSEKIREKVCFLALLCVRIRVGVIK